MCSPTQALTPALGPTSCLAMPSGALALIPNEFTTQAVSVAQLGKLCPTAPKFPVVEATIAQIHEVSFHAFGY